MSAFYRVVKRYIDSNTIAKVLEEGTASLATLRNYNPQIVVRSKQSGFVYEIQVWVPAPDGRGTWMCFMPLPWISVQERTSMKVCFTSADVPFSGDDTVYTHLLAADVPLTGIDMDIPRFAPIA